MAEADLKTEHLEDLDEFEDRPDRYVGKVLAERYRVVRLLGEGGMGAVYEAEHTVIGRRVAIKLLHAQFASESKVVKRFVNEARAAAMIGHPNILDCTDIGQAEDGAPFLVLELLHGQDLDEELSEHGPMQVGRLVEIVLQTASALAAAHDKGIVHRDMKPDNIFLVQGLPMDPHVKVLDFGISKFASHVATSPGTAAGSAMGTPYYMAPEQLRDASGVDRRADVYALGVIMYQALSGTLPFTADSLAGLAMQITMGEAPPLGVLRAGLPEELVDVISKAMAREAEDRYQSMIELMDAVRPFRNVVDGEISVNPAAAAEHSVLSAGTRSHIRQGAGARSADADATKTTDGDAHRRNPVVLGVATIAVLGVVGGLAAMWVSQGDATESSAVAPVGLAPAPAPAEEADPAGSQPSVAPVEVAPVEAPVTTPERVGLHVESTAPNARALVRGALVELPYDDELDARDAPEIIEVNGDRRQSLRFHVTLNEARRLEVVLPRGSGSRAATDEETAAALAGEMTEAAGPPSSRGSRSRSAASSPMAETPTPPSPTPMRANPRVYSGPSGDLPSL